MGLDMYLSAKKSFYPEYDEDGAQMNKVAKKIRENLPELDWFYSNNLDYTTIEIEAGYWRKANQIHNWFVENIQQGNDDCKEYYVSRENLSSLREICTKILDKCPLTKGRVYNGKEFSNGKWKNIVEDGMVMENPEVAEELLPTSEGFFFGSSDYDQWYLDDIKETINIIDKCLSLPEEWEFYYRSSW